MEPTTLRVRLSELSFAAQLPAAALDRLSEIGEFRECKAGEFLFHEGDANRDLYLVVCGHVALDMHVPGRGPVRILTLGPGDLLAWSAIIGRRMTTSAVTLDETRLIVISADRLDEACRQDHEFGYHWMRNVAVALSRRLLATRLQLLDLFADTEPRERGL